MTSQAANLPAILGGLSVRPQDPPDWPRYDDAVREVFERLVQTGDWGRYHGPHGPNLCRQLAHYHDVERVHLCSSGTAAVELALRGLGVDSGDEVILAGYDFKANFQNILCLGAIPVLVDLSPTNWQIDPIHISAAISARTRAIIVSHLHGGVVDMPQVRQLADLHGIPILEDACQNPGAIVHGRKAATWGDVSVLSFGGSKLLTAGRGGAVLTRRAEIAERIKRYVFRGNDAYPFSEMQSAVIIPQITQLDHLNNLRRQAVERICSWLNHIPGLNALQLPTENIQPAYYKLGIQYRADEFGGLSRDLFAASLRAEGIAIDPGFRALHLIHASRRFRAADKLIESTRADAGMLTLHHPILLGGDAGLEEIHQAVLKVRDHAQEISETVKAPSPSEM